MAGMASEVIAGYLRASQLCLEGHEVLTYPATLLLLSATNALGSFLTGETVAIEGKPQRITKREPFRVLNHTLFCLHLTHKHIKLIEQSYRNRLSHNAIIERGSFLLPTQVGAPFIFEGGGVLIRVGSFYRLVSQVWAKFDQNKIAQWERGQRNYQWSSSELLELSRSDELLPKELQTLMQDYKRWKKNRKRNKKKNKNKHKKKH